MHSFCKYVVATAETLVVRDASQEILVRDNPSHGELGVIAYAGVPLVTSEGETLGTFCAIDRQIHDWSEDDLDTLRDLAAAAVAELELRTTVRALAESREHLLSTQAQFREQAVRDDLTGLLNRRGLDEMVRQQLALALRNARPCLLLSLDLDGFKEINDTFGHAVGDHALVDMAGVLRHTFRESDVLARMGGDEFVVLVSNSGPGDIDAVRGRLYAALAARDEGAQRPYRLAASAGIAAFDPAAPTSYAELLRAADASMYAEKRRPRDQR